MIKDYPETLAHITKKYKGEPIEFGPYDKSEFPVAGELRWYTGKNTYKTITAEPGSTIVFGNFGTFVSSHNLNNTATLNSIFNYYSDFTIPAGTNFENCTNAGYLFRYCNNITFGSTEILPKVTTITYICHGASNIKFPKISSKVMTNTSYAFYQAKNITIMPGTKWNTVTDTSYMFQNADGITFTEAIDWAPTNAHYMFAGAKNIKFAPGTSLRPKTYGNRIFGDSAVIAFPPDFIFDPYCTSSEYIFYNNKITAWPDEMKLDHLVHAHGLFMDNTAGLTAGIPQTLTLESATNLNYCFRNCRPYDPVAKKYQRLQHLPKTLNLKSASTCTEFAKDCALSLESITIIADTIKDWTLNGGGTHNIYLGILSSILNTDEVQEQVARIRAKGWTVTTQSVALV